MAAHVTALPASALFWRRTGVALVQMLVQMGGVLPSAHTGVPLVPHWRGCVAVFPVCIRTIPLTCTRTVPVTRTVPIAALRQHCTTVAPAQYTSTISFGGTLFFVYVYLKKCCSFAQKTPARDTSRKKVWKSTCKANSIVYNS